MPPIFIVFWLPSIVGLMAADVPYERIKGDALKEVLRPLPASEPSEALRNLEVSAGFSVEFVAHEPQVLDPVAAAIDENGLMYVAENADYPYRPAEGELPLGRIRLLKDKDGDGFYETSYLFAEGLLWPAGVAPWQGGVFVTAPPDIWYLKDTDGDFKADFKAKVYTGFGAGGSQYILNNLQWGLDHKIYASVAGNGGNVRRSDVPDTPSVSVARKDFRFDPVTRGFESISGSKQFGNTFDDWGNRFLCSQDTPVYQVVFPENYLIRNPSLAPPESTRRLVPAGAPIFRTSPVEVWRAIRSSRRLLAQKGAPEDSGVSHHVLDGVAGVTIYRGGAFPSEFYGNIFCGDAQNNLVHRRSLVDDGVLFRSERLDQGTEFLRSKDNWFRPVNFVNAPDGTLYVLDLAREILEAVHIPMDVAEHLDLTRGRDRGRIYRVVPKGFQRPAPPRLEKFTTDQLVAALESPHSWWRETAHRLLFERQDKSAETPLRRILMKSSQPQSRVHALWSLAGLKTLSNQDVVAALSDPSAPVRENALRLAEPRLNQPSEILSRTLQLTNDPSPRVRFQLAFTLGNVVDPRAVRTLATLAERDATDYFIRTAVLSSSYACAASLLQELLRDSFRAESSEYRQLLEEFARVVGARNQRNEIMPVLSAAFRQKSVDRQQNIVIGLAEGLRDSGTPLDSFVKFLDPSGREGLRELTHAALEVIKDKNSAVDKILIALRLLASSSAAGSAPAIIELLDRFPPAPIQIAVVQSLSQLNAPGLDEMLLAHWRTASPPARREMLSAFLARKDRTDALLRAVERGRIAPGEVDAIARSALLRHPESAIRGRAAAFWKEAKSKSRSEVLAKYRPAIDLPGNARAGENTFQRLCRTCHRLNGSGNELGPNLSLAATRSRDELLTHILDPNREVDPAYIQYTVQTKDGETFSGLMVADQPAGVTLKAVNMEQTVPRSRIKSITSDGQSLMPVGLEQGLSFQDLADLLSFLVESQYDFGTSGQSSSRDVPERR